MSEAAQEFMAPSTSGLIGGGVPQEARPILSGATAQETISVVVTPELAKALRSLMDAMGNKPQRPTRATDLARLLGPVPEALARRIGARSVDSSSWAQNATYEYITAAREQQHLTAPRVDPQSKIAEATA